MLRGRSLGVATRRAHAHTRAAAQEEESEGARTYTQQPTRRKARDTAFGESAAHEVRTKAPPVAEPQLRSAAPTLLACAAPSELRGRASLSKHVPRSGIASSRRPWLSASARELPARRGEDEPSTAL